MNWELRPERAQAAVPSDPYDGWYTPDGVCKALFYRTDHGFLVRFPDEADFEISKSDFSVSGAPAPQIDPVRLRKLFDNGIAPILGNHLGGLFLHGSAVLFQGLAVVFLGASRSGKTTLAGSFARLGSAVLTEDVIDLELRDDGYWLLPKKSALRLFHDSARHLLEGHFDAEWTDLKIDISEETLMPFADEDAPLGHVFIMGEDHLSPISLKRLSSSAALQALMPHSFILDVEDKQRLREHFGRLADLSERICCHTLDYPRDYAELQNVHDAIIQAVETVEIRDATE